MSEDDVIQREYKKITDGLRTAVFPAFDADAKEFEFLVACVCKEKYLLYTNSYSPKDCLHTSVICPYCGRSIRGNVLIAGHSGGLFNAFYWDTRQ